MTLAAETRGALVNVAFAVFAQACTAWVAADASAALDGQVRLALAVVLVAVLALEPWLLRRRLTELAHRAAAAGKLKWGEAPELPHAVFLAIAHLLLGPVMWLVAASGAFGSLAHPVAWLGLVAAVAREIFIFMLLMSPPVASETSKLPSQGVRLAESFGLLAVSCVGFAATWLPIAARGEPINQGGVGLTLVNATIVSLLFLMFFVPARLAWVAEESLLGTGKKWALRVSLALAVLSSLRPLIVVERGEWFVSEARAKVIAHERRR
ncbi:MAG: hypothetical protein U0228_36025 [Myxococcaceae bacterium]